MHKVSILAMALIAIITPFLLAACQAVEPSKELSVNLQPTSQPVDRTLHLEKGFPVADFIRQPRNIQEFVNRVDAILIGTISSVSDLVGILPAGTTEEDYKWATDRGLPLPYIHSIFYDITIEEVLLDDGNVQSNPRLRLSGNHSPIRPQVGERFMFALGVDYDGKSYGVTDDWHLIFLDNGPIRNFNGNSPGYVGITDESSLKEAVKSAVPGRVALPMDQWPRVQANEDAPSETPQAPGGPDDGDGGPTGNTNN